MFDILTHYLDSFLEMGVPGFDCIVFQHGKQIYRHFNGYADVLTHKKINGKELYNLYSCSKIATCVAALQLWEKGAFQLEDELGKYMKEFENMSVSTPDGIVPAKKKITIRNLFTMTAGFSYDLHSPGLERCRKKTAGRCPTRETIRYLAQDPLHFEPGDAFVYSLCHDVLAALVETVSGMEFNEYCTKNIFKKLGMDQTTFLFPPDRIFEITPQFRNENGKVVEISNHNAGYRMGSEYASGGAGVISTAEDYIKLADALSRPDVILKQDTVRMMTTPQLTPRQHSDYGGRGYYYGLGVRCPGPGSPYTDFGWGGAAGAYFAAETKKEIAVFYVQHVLNTPNVRQRQFIIEFVKNACR